MYRQGSARSIRRDPTPAPKRKAPISTVSRRRVPTVRKWNERPVRVFGVVVRGGGFARRCRIGGAVLHLSHRSVIRRAARGAPQIDLHEQSSPPEAQLIAEFKSRSKLNHPTR